MIHRAVLHGLAHAMQDAIGLEFVDCHGTFTGIIILDHFPTKDEAKLIQGNPCGFGR